MATLFSEDGEVQEFQWTSDLTLSHESGRENFVLETPQEFKNLQELRSLKIEAKLKYFNSKKSWYCIVKANLVNQIVRIILSFKDGVISHVQHILLEKKCSYNVFINQLEDILNYLCDVAGEQVGLFMFTMETVLSVGIHQDFVNAILKRLYPNHISDGYKDFRFVNIGWHWIRFEMDGRTIFIYDSDFCCKSNFCKSFKFANCPQQFDNVSCGLYGLCFEIFFKYGLKITPHCLRIDNPRQVVHDLCHTFFFGQMTEVDFIRKYYRGFSKIPMDNSITIFNLSVSVSSENSTTSQLALPPNNPATSFSSSISGA